MKTQTKILAGATIGSAIVTLLVPINAEDQTSVSWNPSTNADGYRIWINYPEPSAPFVIDVGNVTSYNLNSSLIEGAESIQLSAYKNTYTLSDPHVVFPPPGIESPLSEKVWLIGQESIEFEALLVIYESPSLQGPWTEKETHIIKFQEDDPKGKKFFKGHTELRPAK